MGFFGRVFGLTQTGRANKLVSNARRRRLCQKYVQGRTVREPRELALQGIYRVPSAQWMNFYPGYVTEYAKEDIEACAAGRPLKHSNKVVRYDKLGIPPSREGFIKYALTKIHGLKDREANSIIAEGNRSSYTLPMAMKNIRYRQRGSQARYDIGRTAITNTKTSERMYHGQFRGPQFDYSYGNTGRSYTKNNKKTRYTGGSSNLNFIRNNIHTNIIRQKNEEITQLKKMVSNLKNQVTRASSRAPSMQRPGTPSVLSRSRSAVSVGSVGP